MAESSTRISKSGIEPVELDAATYGELARIERDFEDVDNLIIAKQDILSRGLYAKRDALVAKIPHFWALVFEQAPVDIDQFVQPTDSQVFGACLRKLSVARFEIAAGASADAGDVASLGEPRSVAFRFEFGPNEWFSDTVLEKRFWYRRARDGWEGRVSEPVKIHWKPGKDLSEGLTDAARALWDAQAAKLGGVRDNRELRARSMALPAFGALKDLMEKNMEGSQSFFSWFASRGRWVSAEESAEATQKERARRAAGEPEVDEDEDDEAEDDDTELAEALTEVFPEGDELAIAMAEDLWPNAIHYFTDGDEDDEDLSEMDFESDDDEDDEDDDDDEDEEMPDIKEEIAKAAKKGPAGKSRKR